MQPKISFRISKDIHVYEDKDQNEEQLYCYDL